MQRRDNPYTPGAGRKPPYLAGRDRDLEEFSSLIEILAPGGADRSRIFYGLRGVGKTVLLMELDLLASEAGWATTDVQEVGSQPDFRSTFAQMAARLLREMSLAVTRNRRRVALREREGSKNSMPEVRGSLAGTEIRRSSRWHERFAGHVE